MRGPMHIVGATAMTLPLGLALAIAAAPPGPAGSDRVLMDTPSVAPQAGVPLASFVNWESPTVNPIAITPDGGTLLVINQPAARLDLFSLASGRPVRVGSVPVGLDPVSVRVRDNAEAWVVNHISDTVSVVDLAARNVRATLKTLDEPWDVVFAGTPRRAFVSTSWQSTIQIFNPADLNAAPTALPLDSAAPRGLAVSPDGNAVYAAIFESGNATTILGGGSTMMGGFPPNVVSDPIGPYAGVNPPPNSGAAFNPPIAPANQPGLPVGLIVRKNAAGQWLDDNNGNWTSLVSGANAFRSGRPTGWDMPDRDCAIIDANSLSTSFATGLLNIGMHVAINPASGRVTMVGTDATNQIRFEPVIKGRFVRVNLASFDPAAPATKTIVDLNPHLNYATASVPPAERTKSIGDPRAIVWNAAGTTGYVAGLGSNNVIVIDPAGARAGVAPTIPVGEGPAGLALDEARGQLYVLNRFDGSLSVINLASQDETARVALFDPTPDAIKVGRKHLYNTHLNSGLGQAACASCHVNARTDRLGWDLGDPQGTIDPLGANNLAANIPVLAGGFQPFHPMKGPMTTQTMQDIIGKEPHHWRGDRAGIEAFNGAFVGLQGADEVLTSTEMQEFEDFLATITFPPNPFRNFNNSLPTNVPLPGHYRTGRFGNAGQPLPNGNAVSGLNLYRSPTRFLDANAISCVTCHTLPTGAGTGFRLVGFTYQPIPLGPNGENHLMLVSQDGSTNVSMKVPQFRNAYQKVGFTTARTISHAGFGYLHDGSIDSLERFVAEPVFTVANDQEVADLVAFSLALSGSDLPNGSVVSLREPPGPTSKDSPASVGAQFTAAASPLPTAQNSLLNSMLSLANASKIGLIAKGRFAGESRGFRYNNAAGTWQSDRAAQAVTTAALLAGASLGNELTITVVPLGTQTRLGIDRDVDGCLDGDEGVICDLPPCPVDFTNDGFLNQEDLGGFITAFLEEPARAGPGGFASAPCPGEPSPYDALGYQADFNRDCAFDQEDLGGFITEYFSQAENPSSCVPG